MPAAVPSLVSPARDESEIFITYRARCTFKARSAKLKIRGNPSSQPNGGRAGIRLNYRTHSPFLSGGGGEEERGDARGPNIFGNNAPRSELFSGFPIRGRANLTRSRSEGNARDEGRRDARARARDDCLEKFRRADRARVRVSSAFRCQSAFIFGSVSAGFPYFPHPRVLHPRCPFSPLSFAGRLLHRRLLFGPSLIKSFVLRRARAFRSVPTATRRKISRRRTFRRNKRPGLSFLPARAGASAPRQIHISARCKHNSLL